MPQTVEAINHAPGRQGADRRGRQQDRCARCQPGRSAASSPSSAWSLKSMGGDTMFVDISAKQNLHVDKLLEAVLLTADAELDLRANSDMDARGATVEARLDKGSWCRGHCAGSAGYAPRGRYHRGRHFLRPRACHILDENGQPMEAAGPSTPVQVLGLTSRAHRR